jgi:hypothetical protein
VYRIVFISTNPRTRMPHIENGPWHPSRQAAQHWLDFFIERGHPARMRLETAGSLDHRHSLGI